MRTRPRMLQLSMLTLGAFAACTPAEQTPTEPLACKPLSTSACSCALGVGSMRCGSDGKYEVCRCEEPLTPLDAATDATSAALPDAAPVPASTVDAGEVGASDSAKLACEVSALVRKNCSMCHGSEPAFGAPMKLVTWDDLEQEAPRTRGRKTRELALERIKSDASPMPPAPQPRVSPAEVALLERWIDAGAPRAECQGDAGVTPHDGGSPPARIPRPADCEASYELTANAGADAGAGAKFRVSSMPARDGNQYHCFYFEPPYAEGSGLLWFEPILDDVASLHHFILYATDHAKNAPGSSGPCNGAGADTYFVAGWAPGADNTALPSDVALALPSGPEAGLILEVHYYNNSGAAKLDASGVRFCTAKRGARPHTAGVHFLGSEGICIPPGSRSFEVKGACAPRSDLGDIHITGLWPHMHKRARRQRLLIRRSDGSSEVLHDQPFDFNTQLFYPKPDVVIRAGDRIETTCFYDNESNEQISYGERTQDEMCYAFVTAWPAGALSAVPLFAGSVLQINRCGEDLSILASCNGIDDSPQVIVHPP